MLVKVKESFRGTFGQFDVTLNTVNAKKAGDEPFEVPDSVARVQIAAGVLEKAEGKSAVEPVAPAEPEPVQPEPVNAEPEEKPAKKPARSRSKSKKKNAEEPPEISAADPE